MTLLEIDTVHAGYARSTVLHGVSLTVPRDGVAAVLGHNGAGKSTLLRAAAGLLIPSRGAVRLDGEDVTRLRPHQRVARGLAYVPQGQQCFPQLTAAENLRLVADGRPAGPPPTRPSTSSRPCAPSATAPRASSPAASASNSPWPEPW